MLTQRERLDIIADLCPRGGIRRACDSFDLARDHALEILGEPERAAVSADYVLMKAIDRYLAGSLAPEDLYRCRVLAYYMTFGRGGEEWERWGVAAGVSPGGFPAETEALDLDEPPPIPPAGPPWRHTE
jgi:hypothetical protein